LDRSKPPEEKITMGIITFPAPPKDFDPATASARSLAQFGLPRRPDPKTEPGLRKLWDRAFARKPTIVQARLVEDKVWHSRPRKAWKKEQFGLAGNWAGAVVEVASLDLNPPEPANVVFAEWTVPAINPKPAETGTQIVGFWVGLGGYGTNNLLQAGTAATITGSSVKYWAWTEWVPAGYVVDNLAVEAGDVVSVLVCAPESDHGYVSMMNHRTNIAISVGVSDPQGTTPYDGSSVEWIVEAIETEMPNFGSVAFTQVTAGTQHHTINLSHAFTVNTVSGGTTLATGKVLASEHEVEVIWDALG
jgi:Peptidase A4 family